MKFIPFIFLVLSCGPDLRYQDDFLETENCNPCIEDVQTDVVYQTCVPVDIDKSNFDLSGTWWFRPFGHIDSVIPVLDLRDDGVLRRIYLPGIYGEASQIRSSRWKFEDGLFTETTETGSLSLEVAHLGSSYVSWNVDPMFDPWIRVQCSGFGFGDVDLSIEADSCDCDSTEICRASVSPRNVCLPAPINRR